MTQKNEQTSLGYGLYQNGAVAGLALQNRDMPSARKSLARLVSDLVPSAHPEVQKNLAKQYELCNDEQVATFSGFWNQLYLEALNKATVKDIFNNYGSSVTLYTGTKNNAVLKEFGENKWGDIVKKVQNAEEIRKSTSTNFTDEQKEEAKKTLEKYALIYTIAQNLEGNKIQELYTPLVQDSIREKVEERYSKQKEEK